MSSVRLRDRAQSESHYRAAQEIVTEHSIAKDVGAIHKDLAYLTLQWGELDTAERHARAAIEAAGAIGDRYLLPGAVTNLALVLMQKGYVDDARQEFQIAIHDFTALPNPGGEAFALYELPRLEHA